MKKTVVWTMFFALTALAAPLSAAAANQDQTDFAARRYAKGADAPAPGVGDKIVPEKPAQGDNERAALEIPPASPTPAGEQLSADMEQSVRRSIELNPQIESAKAQLRGAIEGKKAAFGALLPSVSASGYYQTQNVNTAYKANQTSVVGAGAGVPNTIIANPNTWLMDLNVHQSIFAGFRLLSNYQKAGLLKDSAEAGVSAAELKLLNQVQQSFLALLKARADVKNAEDSVARLKSQLEMSKAFYEVGLKPRLDVLQNETALANGIQVLIAARNAVLTQEAQLNTYLVYPLDQYVNYVGELTYLPFNMTLEQCLELAYKNRPDLFVAVKSVEVASKDAKIAISNLYPQVALDLDYITSTNRADFQSTGFNYDQQVWQAKLGMQWTAWDFGATYYGYTQAVENVKKLYADMVNLRLTIGFQVKASFLAIVNSAKRIGVARTGLDAARENYRMAVARYQAQVGTSLDVLTAQSQMTQAEADLSQALTDYETALSNLYASVGTKNYNLNPS